MMCHKHQAASGASWPVLESGRQHASVGIMTPADVATGRTAK